MEAVIAAARSCQPVPISLHAAASEMLAAVSI
jgi:hypothetical protein